MEQVFLPIAQLHTAAYFFKLWSEGRLAVWEEDDEPTWGPEEEPDEEPKLVLDHAQVQALASGDYRALASLRCGLREYGLLAQMLRRADVAPFVARPVTIHRLDMQAVPRLCHYCTPNDATHPDNAQRAIWIVGEVPVCQAHMGSHMKILCGLV